VSGLVLLGATTDFPVSGMRRHLGNREEFSRIGGLELARTKHFRNLSNRHQFAFFPPLRGIDL
jgi:hypothetical protein